MRKDCKAVRAVVAYEWADGHQVTADDLWPGRQVSVDQDGRRVAVMNTDLMPTHLDTERQPAYELPVCELLDCGHALPMRKTGQRVYVRPGRVCVLCASGVAPE